MQNRPPAASICCQPIYYFEKSGQRSRGQYREADLQALAALATPTVLAQFWFRIREGIRGLLVRDERGVESVYMMCEPSLHY